KGGCRDDPAHARDDRLAAGDVYAQRHEKRACRKVVQERHLTCLNPQVQARDRREVTPSVLDQRAGDVKQLIRRDGRVDAVRRGLLDALDERLQTRARFGDSFFQAHATCSSFACLREVSSFTMPSMTASGRGGQPGTYTSTGMTLSMPLHTA